MLVYLNSDELVAIADAIRAKLGEESTYLPSEMPEKIMSIVGGDPGPGPVPEFDWGSETDVGDLAWWTSLKAWVAAVDESELAQCLGKTKKVTLNNSVLGTTTHLVRCIGYNLDRDKNNVEKNTLTFHSDACFSTTTPFDSNEEGQWNIASIKKTDCKNYYNALPFKDLVCTVSKGTGNKTADKKNATPVYTDETIFIPSASEMGYTSDSSDACSYDEFCQQNTAKKPYPYYSSDALRMKGTSMYWTRSMCYHTMYRCVVVHPTAGRASFDYADSKNGFAPAFVI